MSLGRALRSLNNASAALLIALGLLHVASAQASSALDAVPNCDSSEDKKTCVRWEAGSIRFSPDGNFLLFSYRYIVSYSPVTPWVLARVNLSDLSSERIVEYPNCSTGFSQFDISSDGKSIAAQISKPDESEHIGTVDLDTRKATILVSPDGKKNTLGMPVYAKGGKKLFYYSQFSGALQVDTVDVETGEILHVYPPDPAKCERTICWISNGGTDLRGIWNFSVDPNSGALVFTIEYQRNEKILSVAQGKTGRSIPELKGMKLMYQLTEDHTLSIREESFRLLAEPPEGENRRSSFSRISMDDHGDVYFTISPHYLAKSTFLYKVTADKFEPFFTFAADDNSPGPISVNSFALSPDHQWIAYSYQSFSNTKRKLSSFFNVIIVNLETGAKKIIDLGTTPYRDLASTCEPPSARVGN